MAVDENWRIDLERWLEPFLAGYRIQRGAGCVRCILRA